jgi:DNA-binding transcriptional LysR family regulator
MALRVIEAVDALGDGQESASRTVSGKVKLSMPAPLGLYISDRLPQFLDSYPRLAVELLLREEASDLVGEGIDLEIRLGQVTDNNLVCRRIGWTTAFLVAAPDYLQNRPEPGIPADIGGHNCICYNRAGDNTTWSFSNGAGEVCVRPARRLIASNSMAVHRAVLSGGGLAVLSHILTGADIQAGRLKKLMPEYPPTRLPINVVYLSRRNLPLRVRVTLDFLVSVVRDDPCMTSAIYEG